MTRLINQINAVRDPPMVERILIANSRTIVRELDSVAFEHEDDLMKQVAEYIADNKPFVVRGGAKNWKVVSRFNNFDALLDQAKMESDLLPDRKYTAYKPDADGYLNQSHAAPFGFMSFYKFLTTGMKNQLYLLGVPDQTGRGASPFEKKPNDAKPPIFSEDIDLDPGPHRYTMLFTTAMAIRRHVFFNSSRSYTNLHYDTDWNMYLCALGRRRWYIAHPEHAKLLAANNGSANYSKLQPSKGITGMESVRLAHLVKFATVNLETSDLLFVPPTWWHVVESPFHGFSCGINWFFTCPIISTVSRIDRGWKWAMSPDSVLISPTTMGASSTMIEQLPEREEDSVVDPGIARQSIPACSGDSFVREIEAKIISMSSRLPSCYSMLKPKLNCTAPDFMIARQLVAVAVMSIKQDGYNDDRFRLLCEEITGILERRATSFQTVARPNKRKSLYN